ncbi:hypothetical protein Q7C36_023308 [Tachysurus vachellii]|uniref:Uncharacterized protein n=1 Tax=Tachysurus vachellii TaxID=175792 RepID=A0AA88J0B2_TACVA|nr:hypothetical protein Q7C36_023308 [Tachysurus vachellii]
MAAATARAQAEAARTRVLFVKKENVIKLDKIKLEMSHKLDKARMEADLEVLQHEKEQAAALAQAEVLEAAVASIEDSISNASFSVSSHSKVERTKDYVEMQSGVELNKPKETDIQNSNYSNKLYPETSDPNCSARSFIKMNREQDAFTELSRLISHSEMKLNRKHIILMHHVSLRGHLSQHGHIQFRFTKQNPQVC